MRPLSAIITRKGAVTAAFPVRLAPRQMRLAFRKICLLAVAVTFSLTVFPGRSSARDNPSAGNAKGVQILLLGTKGGPPLLLNRSEPSTLLIVDGRRYLIDCGIGTMRRLVRAGVPSQSIRTIFITHHHPDHDLGLVAVMGNDFYTLDQAGPRATTTTIDIYGPPQTGDLVKAVLSFIDIPFGVFEGDGLTSGSPVKMFNAHDIDSAGVVFQDDKIRVTAVENTHFTLMPAKYHTRMKSYAYRFDTRYGAIVFTGDTGPSDAVTRLAKGADVLVSEVIDIPAITKYVNGLAEQGHWTQKRKEDLMAHMKFEHLPMKDLGEMATKAHVKSLVLDHYVPVQDPAIFVSGVKKYFSGPMLAGEDLAQYCLGAPGVSRTDAHTLRPCH
jgi:ribonuclease BN (tRNA processing enzyme)